jgi:hypothetical protein
MRMKKAIRADVFLDATPQREIRGEIVGYVSNVPRQL